MFNEFIIECGTDFIRTFCQNAFLYSSDARPVLALLLIPLLSGFSTIGLVTGALIFASSCSRLSIAEISRPRLSISASIFSYVDKSSAERVPSSLRLALSKNALALSHSSLRFCLRSKIFDI